MHREALQYLACPECKGSLKLSVTARENSRIQEGVLSCTCGRAFPVINAVPRLLTDALFGEIVERKHAAACRRLGVSRGSIARDAATQEKLRTQDAFGFSWKIYPKLFREYAQQFLSWIQPVQPAFFRNKLVLDAGCGKGRHCFFAAKYGASHVIGLDLSDAVDIAAANTREFSNVTIVQGDILQPPLKRVFDYAYSIGVIHHLPSPAAGFASLHALLKKGGAFSVWVYGKENNALLPFCDWWRTHFFTRIPKKATYALAVLGSAVVGAAIFGLYVPLGRLAPSLARKLPQYEFLRYLGRLNREIRTNITFDQMIAPTAYYLPRSEVERWYREAGLQGTVFTWRNRNSWCGFGLKP